MTTVEDFLDPNKINIPESLYQETVLSDQFSRRDTIEVVWLFWHLVASWNANDKNKEWSYVANSQFKRITTDRKTITKAKQYLLENGYLEQKLGESGRPIKKLPTEDKPGICEQWKANLTDEKQVAVTLEFKDSLGVYNKHSDNEEMCRYSINVQNTLNVKLGEIGTYIEVIEPQIKTHKMRTRIRNAARVLHHKSGHARRGSKVNRIFSTFAHAPRITRSCFQLDGNECYSFDMSSCHPVLLANELGDIDLLERCYDDSFYQELMEITGTTRRKSKTYWNIYAQGPNEPEWWDNKTRAIQDHMRVYYPTTFNHVWQEKTEDHKPFSQYLQNLESGIFVDSILRQIKEQDACALTVHDSIVCKHCDANIVEEIMQQVLTETIPSGRFKIKRDDLSKGVQHCYDASNNDSD